MSTPSSPNGIEYVNVRNVNYRHSFSPLSHSSSFNGPEYGNIRNPNHRFSFNPSQPLPPTTSTLRNRPVSEVTTTETNSSSEYGRSGNLNSSYDPPLPTRVKSPKSDSKCRSFVRNFPYFTCLAAIFCCVGGGLFAGYIHAVADLTIKMLQDSMHITYPWMEGVEILCTALGCLMIFLSLLIFFSSFIVGTTASTPNNYVVGQDNDKRSKSRNVVRNPSSQAPSLIYTCLLAPALPIWFFLMGITIFFGLLSRILNGVCTTEEIQPLWSTSPAPQSEVCQTVLEGEDCVDCIDLYQFHFLFPASARKEDMWICGKEIVVLCATDMEHIIKYWTLAFVGSILVIAGIFVHFMNLSYTRTVLQKEKVIKEIEEDIFIKKKVALAMKAKKRHSRDPDFKAPLILHERD